MVEYEKSISLRDVYLTLVRRTEMILIIFIPLFLASFLVTNFVMPKKYTSSTTINNGGSAITQATYSSIQMSLQTSSIFGLVEENLATGGIKHSSGAPISLSDISSGLEFSSFASNMVSFTISFSSSDKAISKPVLESYSSIALTAVADTFPNLSVYSSATEAIKTSSENKYFLLASAASVVLALAVPFAVEIVEDKIFDANDIKTFGSDGFELKVSG